LGLFYGFLRPIRRGKAILPDLIFVAAAGWIYVYYGFAICRGDLRMGYMAAPLLGAILWDRLFGRWLLPIYGGIWQLFAGICRPFLRICKKIWDFIKFLFASVKKWGTMKRKERRGKKPPHKGVSYERKEKSLQSYPADLPPQFHPGQVCGVGGDRAVHRSAHNPSHLHPRRAKKAGAAASAATSSTTTS
jgi:hypothetical protein